MRLSRRRQLLLLAAIMLTVAISSTGWWITSSPHGVSRAAQAMMILVTGVCAVSSTRRITERTPFVLAVTLVGLAMALMMNGR